MGSAVNQRPTVTTGHILQGAGKIKLDGIELGSFQGGVKINHSQSEKMVESDYALGPVDSEVDKVGFEVSTELEEATIETLAAAWGMYSSSVTSAAVSSSKLLNLIPEKTLIAHALSVEGMSALDRNKVRLYTFTNVIKAGASSISLQRGTKLVVPVTFKCLLDATGSFGTVQESSTTNAIS
jgi:hypothetical protein